MTSISQRAIAASNIPRDPNDRDRLREEWRLAAVEHAKAKDVACRLEEGRKMLMSLRVTELVTRGMPVGRAENEVRASNEFMQHVEAMHTARLAADMAWVAAENADRLYWALINEEANSRTERRLSR